MIFSGMVGDSVSPWAVKGSQKGSGAFLEHPWNILPQCCSLSYRQEPSRFCRFRQ